MLVRYRVNLVYLCILYLSGPQLSIYIRNVGRWIFCALGVSGGGVVCIL